MYDRDLVIEMLEQILTASNPVLSEGLWTSRNSAQDGGCITSLIGSEENLK